MKPLVSSHLMSNCFLLLLRAYIKNSCQYDACQHRRLYLPKKGVWKVGHLSLIILAPCVIEKTPYMYVINCPKSLKFIKEHWTFQVCQKCALSRQSMWKKNVLWTGVNWLFNWSKITHRICRLGFLAESCNRVCLTRKRRKEC